MTDEELMRLAIEEGRNSNQEPDQLRISPKVGAGVARDGHVPATAYRGEIAEGEHAEFTILEHKLKGQDLRGATAYVTLEPCSERNHPKRPCAERLVESGIRRMFIGMYDPNPKIYRAGWNVVRTAGFEMRDFPDALHHEIEKDNAEFIRQYHQCDRQAVDGCVINHVEGTRTFSVIYEGERFETRWSQARSDEAYVYGDVAIAHFALMFGEIDNANTFTYTRDSIRTKKDEIVIFRTEKRFLLVKVRQVCERLHGDAWNGVESDYEVRVRT